VRCPKCNGATKVLRTEKGPKEIIRRRACKECGHRFPTREKKAERVWVDVS